MRLKRLHELPVASEARRSFVLEVRTTATAEPFEAYAADALVAMARASMSGGTRRKSPTGGSDAKIIVRVDHAAVLRGHAEPGELCEISGIGPIPVTEVHRLIDDGAFLAAVVTEGVEVMSVARTDWADSHRTAVDDADRLCPHHHDLKTYNGWSLEPGTGKRRLVSPLPGVAPAPRIDHPVLFDTG